MSQGYLSWARLTLPAAPLAITAAQGHAGSPFVTVSVGLTGNSGTSALGAFGVGSPRRGYLSWAQLTIPTGSGTSVALTGQAGSGGYGSLTGGGTRGYLSWARLTLPPASSVALIGDAATGAIGSLSRVTGTVQALTGVGGTGSAGSIAQGRAGILSGIPAFGSAGTLTANDENFGFIGILVPSNTEGLSGYLLTGLVGSFGVLVNGGVQVQLVGLSSTIGIGALSKTSLVAFSGAGGSASAGVMSSNSSLALTGQSALASQSTFFLGQVMLSGQSATAQTGTFTLLGASWAPVLPGGSIWTEVTPVTSSWTNVNN